MRVVGVMGLLLLMTGACVAHLGTVVGIYDLVEYHGKPLPFDGVRSGEIHLMQDGTFKTYTKRAVVMGQPLSVSDSVFGTVSVRGWRGSCAMLTLRAEEESSRAVGWGEACGDELTFPDEGSQFRKRRKIGSR